MATLTSQINVVVDTKTKNEAASILEDLGLSMSTAINIYLRKGFKPLNKSTISMIKL